MRGDVTITGYSGDMSCAGTPVSPCYAYLNFTANTDIYIYPSDNWNDAVNESGFYTDQPVKEIIMQRSWGNNWRTISLNQTWNKNVKYAIKFSTGKYYQIRFIGYKHNPNDLIKWGFTEEVDPVWFPADSSFNVEWKNCTHGLTQHSCLVDIQNLDSTDKRDFNLSSVISDTNYENYLTNMTIKEWKALDITSPTYAVKLINQTCYDYNNITLVNTSYDCSYNETFQNGTQTKSQAQWKPTKSNMLKEGSKQKMYYGTIIIPKLNSKDKLDDFGNVANTNGTKTFLIEWTTPIIKTESAWGSSGKIVLVNELTGDTYE